VVAGGVGGSGTSKLAQSLEKDKRARQLLEAPHSTLADVRRGHAAVANLLLCPREPVGDLVEQLVRPGDASDSSLVRLDSKS
jgi:hypothetical protein